MSERTKRTDAGCLGCPELSQQRRKRTLFACIFAICSTLGVTGLAVALDGLWSNRALLFAFVLAITATALFGGFWPTLLATALGALAAAYIFLGEPYNMSVEEPADQALLVLFLVSGVLIAGVSARMRHALTQSRLDRDALALANRELQRQGEDRERELAQLVAVRTAELHESEGKFRALFASDVVPLIFWHTDGRISEANDAFLRLVGWSREELQRGELRWTAITPPEWRAQDERLLVGLRETGRIPPTEKEYWHKDGRRIPILLGGSALPDHDADGVSFVLDRTEQKRSEREREILLESERAARTEAERANRLKDDFVATVSHELRTPLNAILGWTHLLGKPGRAPEQLEKGLAIIERNTRLQVQLISDLLDVSRIVSGKLEVQRAPVDCAAVVEAALEGVRGVAEGKGVALHAATPRERVMVHGDAGRLSQVVWNLVSNAIQFTPKGGRVDVTLARRGAGVELAVGDTGQGIPPEFLPHLFERFRQANSSAARKHGGLGLGLSIVKHVVEIHGGKVRAESEGIGRGARFVVELPAEPPPIERRAPEQVAAPSEPCELTSITGATILVVDDEPDGRELVQRLLEEHGARVVTAPSAPDALASLEREVPDLLVSDIGMPGMDGYELIRTVRAQGSPPAKELPAIALTAFARAEDRERALEAGFAAHVSKPLEPAELLVTVAGLLADGSAPAAQP